VGVVYEVGILLLDTWRKWIARHMTSEIGDAARLKVLRAGC
jgi:hypothetical protein